jgi:hypothetical protein
MLLHDVKYRTPARKTGVHVFDESRLYSARSSWY